MVPLRARLACRSLPKPEFARFNLQTQTALDSLLWTTVATQPLHMNAESRLTNSFRSLLGIPSPQSLSLSSSVPRGGGKANTQRAYRSGGGGTLERRMLKHEFEPGSASWTHASWFTPTKPTTTDDDVTNESSSPTT